MSHERSERYATFAATASQILNTPFSHLIRGMDASREIRGGAGRGGLGPLPRYS
jgi:hypothetical protein